MLPMLRGRHLPVFEAPGVLGGGGTAPPADPPDGLFSRDYVVSLRAEAATSRVRAREAIATLAEVGQMLGLDADAMKDPARVRHTASTLRLTADLEAGIARHGLDRKLTLAVIAQESALADVQPGQPDTSSRLDEVLTRLAKETPALRAGGPALSARGGAAGPFAGPPVPQKITPREIREGHYSADEIARLQRAGLIDHSGPR